MTAKPTAESFLPTADTIRRMGGFDETEYVNWLKTTCGDVTTLLEERSAKLVSGEGVEFTIAQAQGRAYELWLRHYSKVKDALIRKGFKVDESLTRSYGQVIGVLLTITLEN
jgi:hypothetical protein